MRNTIGRFKDNKVNQHGITLITLVITIIVLIILSGIATYSGIEAIDNTKRTTFIAELKIMQSYVNRWYEELKPTGDETWAAKTSGKFGVAPVNAKLGTDESISTKVNQALTAAGISIEPGNFYLLEDTQKQALGVEGVSQSVLISVQDRKVVSYLGLKYKGNMYYTIDNLDSENGIDAIYNVGYQNPNSGQPAFSVKSECLGSGLSKITVYDVNYNSGYNTKWKVYYKKDYDEKWFTSDELSFNVYDDGVYTIKLTNQNGDIVGTTTAEVSVFAYKKKNSALSGTTDKAQLTYKNPVIPQGFKAVDTDEAKWSYKDNSYSEIDGWNNGLVIEDDIGNQFVWVPCTMGTSTDVVTYSKDLTYPLNVAISDLNVANDLDTVSVEGTTYSAIPVRENEQIFNYGGFYVARYEAGLSTDTLDQSNTLNNIYTSIPVSKAGAKVWNYIDYNHSFVAAEKMINNSSKYGNNKSGLITGTQWDTIMQWYEKNGIRVGGSRVTGNQNWGIYYNLNYSLDGLYFTNNQKNKWNKGNASHSANTSPVLYGSCGLNSIGYKNNIADLGGNIWERTSEMSPGYKIYRGGGASNNSYGRTASQRFLGLSATATSAEIGFRTVLYIQDEPQKEYVTDGLIAYYDAENNTGMGHSFDTTTWKDLSGNNNDATIYNIATTATADSGWHSNYLALDGVDDYISKTGIIVDGANGTVEIIAKINGNFNSINSFNSNDTYKPEKMQVYAVRVYNRALTEDEIRQNYEIDKVRFNIQD